jgi:hypothetical protein
MSFSLFSSLLFSLPFKELFYFFFPMPTFGLKFRLFCQILHAGYGEDLPHNPIQKSFQHSGDFRAAQLAASNMT